MTPLMSSFVDWRREQGHATQVMGCPLYWGMIDKAAEHGHLALNHLPMLDKGTARAADGC